MKKEANPNIVIMNYFKAALTLANILKDIEKKDGRKNEKRKK